MRPIPKCHWPRLAVHGVTVERLREGTVDEAAQLVLNAGFGKSMDGALEYVATARGEAVAPPLPRRRSASRPHTEAMTGSIDQRLRALMREHGVEPAVAIRRGACEELRDRGVDVPLEFWRPRASR